jgi:multiple sugar transport system substrate-binding protein
MRVRVGEHACRRRLRGLSYESEGGQAVKSGSKLIAGILGALSLVFASCAPTVPVQPTAPPGATTPAPEATQLPSGAAAEVALICRCVLGGVNTNSVTWLNQTVFPRFREQMAAQGKQVSPRLVEFGGSDEELKAQYALDLKAGKGHDILAFDGFWTAEFVAGGLIKPLDAIAGLEANQWEGWDHIPQTVQSLLMFEGKRFGVPQGSDARVIWYRKDLFKQAGLPEIWQPSSWDEVLSAARQIKKALPDVVPMQVNGGTAMGEATTMQGYYLVLTSAGGWIFDEEKQRWIARSPAMLDALNFYKTIYLDEKLGDDRLQLLKDGRNRSFAQFRDGKIAMLWEGDFFWRSVLAPGSEWTLPNRDTVIGFAKVPARQPGQGYRGQDFVTASGGTGFILNPNTKNPKEAWALLSFMFSREMLLELQKIEPRIRARDDVPVSGDPVMTEFGKLLPLTVVRPTLPIYPKVSQAAQVATERVVTGEMTPDQALEAYAKEVTDLAGPENVISVE